MNTNEYYNRFFSRYGADCDEGNAVIHLYHTRPDAIDTLDRIAREDLGAQEDIQKLEQYIAVLKHYREELCKRYNELATAATLPGVKLVRERQSWNGGKVFYRLTHYTHYIDSDHDVVDKETVYKGTERRTAIAAYQDYIKAHPGILAKMDIEKSKWEK